MSPKSSSTPKPRSSAASGLSGLRTRATTWWPAATSALHTNGPFVPAQAADECRWAAKNRQKAFERPVPPVMNTRFAMISKRDHAQPPPPAAHFGSAQRHSVTSRRVPPLSGSATHRHVTHGHGRSVHVCFTALQVSHFSLQNEGVRKCRRNAVVNTCLCAPRWCLAQHSTAQFERLAHCTMLQN